MDTWAAITVGWLALNLLVVLLARRIQRRLLEDAVNHSMTTDFRRDDPVDPPALEDSSVWNVPKLPDPTVDEGLPVILAMGTRALRCGACRSELTTHESLGWVSFRGQVYNRVLEQCQNCGAQQAYDMDQIRAACIAAQRAWDEFGQAQETITVALANEALPKDIDLDQVRKDLRDLDE